MAALPFVGREVELALLRDTCIGGGTAVVVAESGYGKSRLIDELHRELHLTDASFLISAGASELSQSPYALFRALALQASRLLDPAELGWTDAEIDTLGPLFSHVGVPDSGGDTATTDRRQSLWLSVLRYFDALVADHDKPVVVVVEDLQFVDESSLALFAWLASQRVGMAMIGTCRPGLPDVVAKLPTIGLPPLGEHAVQSLVDAVDAETDARSLFDRTGGSPRRLHEWWMTRSFGETAQAASMDLDRRLQGCNPGAIDAVRAMAVFPASMGAAMIDAVVASDAPDVTADESLAELQRRNVVQPTDDNGWRFSPERYRRAVVESLDPSQKRRWERRVLDGLEPFLPERPELLAHAASVSEALGDDRVRAARLHVAAARYANDQLAPEAARDHYRTAIALTEGGPDERLEVEARLGFALALAEASDPETGEALSSVYEAALRLGDHDSFARAALAEIAGPPDVVFSVAPAPAVVQRLRTAAELDADPRLRARALVALAWRSGPSVSGGERAEMIERAEHHATRVDDPSIRGLVLAARLRDRSHTDPAGARAEAQQQIDARKPRDEATLALVDVAATSACRSGDLTAAGELLRRIDDTAQVPLALRWKQRAVSAGVAYARGSVEMARSLALDGLHLTTGTRLDALALDHFGLQLCALLRERRRLDEMRPTIETWVAKHPAYPLFRSWRAWLNASLGEEPVARSDLEVFFAQDLDDVRATPDGPAAIAMAVDAVACLGGRSDATWSGRAHQALQPLADQWIVTELGSIVEGPVTRVLALASAAVGDFDRALAENRRAHDKAMAAGAQLFGWAALRDRGRILNAAGEFDEARKVMRTAAERYRSAGLVRQADWIQDMTASWSATADGSEPNHSGAPEAASIHGEFRREHHVWHVSLGDESGIVPHLKGMPMIAALLDHPGRDIAASVLAVVGDGSTPHDTHRALRAVSRQEVLDDEAVASYRRRLDQIVIELERADRLGDATESERLGQEFATITGELQAQHGLGGRRRAMTTDDERARVRVNKAIRTSLRRIEEQVPTLAEHLDRSIATGAYCCYRPGPLGQIVWTLA